jgi:hypothetical protein
MRPAKVEGSPIPALLPAFLLLRSHTLKREEGDKKGQQRVNTFKTKTPETLAIAKVPAFRL